jgi:hypothetical protein
MPVIHSRKNTDITRLGAVGWVEPKAKPTGTMPIIHSRKIIEITRLGSWVVPLLLCEQCAAWSRWVSPLALPTLPDNHPFAAEIRFQHVRVG